MYKYNIGIAATTTVQIKIKYRSCLDLNWVLMFSQIKNTSIVGGSTYYITITTYLKQNNLMKISHIL